MGTAEKKPKTSNALSVQDSSLSKPDKFKTDAKIYVVDSSGRRRPRGGNSARLNSAQFSS